MPDNFHPLTEQVQEIFTESPLTPDATLILLEELNDYFSRNTVVSGDYYPDMVSKLYALADNKRYSIITVCGANNYDFYMIPALTELEPNLVKSTSPKVIELLKQRHESQELFTEIKKVNNLLKAIVELLDSSTRTTRKAIGTSEKPLVEYPSYEELKLFYECGRKARYETSDKAEAALEPGNSPYLCSHCQQYHQGRTSATPSNEQIPEHVMLGRYKTVWRRHNNV